jgi:hypothetical protein
MTADQGNVDGENNYGRCLQEDRGVEQDLIEGAKYYKHRHEHKHKHKHKHRQRRGESTRIRISTIIDISTSIGISIGRAQG